MQLEYFLGNPDNLRMVSLGTNLSNSIMVDGRSPCARREATVKEASTNESLMPLDYGRHSCLYSRTLVLENLCLELEWNENLLTHA